MLKHRIDVLKYGGERHENLTDLMSALDTVNYRFSQALS